MGHAGLNFRDLGGTQLTDGTRIPSGLYMRSGKLSVLTPEQCEAFCHKHHISCIIDLRTPVEAEEYPDPVPSGVDYLQIPILTDATVGITHELGSDPMTVLRKLRHEPQRIMQMIPDMRQMYLRMVTDDYSVCQVRKVVDLLQQRGTQGQGTLIHCTAGKDRTGIVMMALLMRLGTSEDTILADFMRTNRNTIWPTLRKCIGVWLLTRNWQLVCAAFRCFMANRQCLKAAMSHSRI